jgi:aminoglycoside phosphotransferase (APT) family kinase protein
MDAEQLEQFSIDCRDHVKHLRSIPNPYSHLICSALGGEYLDGRIDHDNGGNGPYENVEDMNRRLMSICSPIPDAADRALVADVHSRSYRVLFAHADLNPGNVLVHNGRLSGFVDWEFAGWYPEYWEYSKACYLAYGWQLWLETMKKVFPEYPDEWKAHTCPL